MSYLDEIAKRRRKFMNQFRKGNLEGCMPILEKLVALQRKNPARTTEFADDLYNYATVSFELADYDNAKELYLECIEIPDERKLPGRHFNAGINLALCYANLGNYPEAKKRLIDCIYLCEDNDSSDIVDCRYNLANVYYMAGEYAFAIDQFMQLIKKESADEILKSDCYMCAGYCHEKTGNFDEALKCFKKALGITKSVLGSDHEETFTVIYYIAQTCALNRRFDEALKHYKASASVLRTLGRDKSAYFTDICNRIADMYAMQGDPDKSLYHRIRALKLMKSQIGEEHIYYANNLKNAALAYKEKNMTDKAADYLLRSMKIKEKILGSASMDCIRDVMQLSGLYIERFEYESAVKMLTRAMDTLKEEGGKMDEVAAELGMICGFLSNVKSKGEPKKNTDIIERLKSAENKMLANREIWF